MLLFPEYLEKKKNKLKKKINRILQKGGIPSESDSNARLKYASSETFFEELLNGGPIKNMFINIKESDDSVIPTIHINKFFTDLSVDKMINNMKIAYLFLTIILLQPNDFVLKFTSMLSNNSIRILFNTTIKYLGENVNLNLAFPIRNYTDDNIKQTIIIFFDKIKRLYDDTSKHNNLEKLDNKYSVNFINTIRSNPRNPTAIQNIFNTDDKVNEFKKSNLMQHIMRHLKKIEALKLDNMTDSLDTKAIKNKKLNEIKEEIINLIDLDFTKSNDETNYDFFKDLSNLSKYYIDKEYNEEFNIILLLQYTIFYNANFNLIEFYISYSDVLHKNNFVNILLSKLKFYFDLDYIENYDKNDTSVLVNNINIFIKIIDTTKENSKLIQNYKRDFSIYKTTYKKNITGITLNEKYNTIIINNKILTEYDDAGRQINISDVNIMFHYNLLFIIYHLLENLPDNIDFFHALPNTHYVNIPDTTSNKYNLMNDLCVIFLLKIRNFDGCVYLMQLYKKLFYDYTQFKKTYKDFFSEYANIESNISFGNQQYIDKLKTALKSHLEAMNSSALKNKKGIASFINLLKTSKDKVNNPLVNLKLTNSIFTFDSFVQYIEHLNQDFNSNMQQLQNLLSTNSLSSQQIFIDINSTVTKLNTITENFKKLSAVLEVVTLQLKENIDPIEEFKENLSIKLIPSDLFVRPTLNTEEIVDVSTNSSEVEQLVSKAIENMTNFKQDIQDTQTYVTEITALSPTHQGMAEIMEQKKQSIPDLINKLKTIKLSGGGNINNLKLKWNNKINKIVNKLLNEEDNNDIIVNDNLNISKINKDIIKINNINHNKTNIMKKYINKIYNNIKSNNKLNNKLNNLSGGTIDKKLFKNTLIDFETAYKEHSINIKKQAETIIKYNNTWSQFQYHLIHMIVENNTKTIIKTLSLSTIIYYKNIVKEICDHFNNGKTSGSTSITIHGYSFECLYIYLESLEKYFGSISFQSQFCDFWQFKENKNISDKEIKKFEKNIELLRSPPAPSSPSAAPSSPAAAPSSPSGASSPPAATSPPAAPSSPSAATSSPAAAPSSPSATPASVVVQKEIDNDYITYEPFDSIQHKVVLAFTENNHIKNWEEEDGKILPNLQSDYVKTPSKINPILYVYVTLHDSLLFMINCNKIKTDFYSFYRQIYYDVFVSGGSRAFNFIDNTLTKIGPNLIKYILLIKFIKLHYTYNFIEAIKYLIDNDYRFTLLQNFINYEYFSHNTYKDVKNLLLIYEDLYNKNNKTISELMSITPPTSQITSQIRFIQEKRVKLLIKINNLTNIVDKSYGKSIISPIKENIILSYVQLDTYYQQYKINTTPNNYENILEKICDFINIVNDTNEIKIDDYNIDNNILFNNNILYFVNIIIFKINNSGGSVKFNIKLIKEEIISVLFNYLNIIFSHMNKLKIDIDIKLNITKETHKKYVLFLLYKYNYLKNKNIFIKTSEGTNIKEIFNNIELTNSIQLQMSGITITNWYETDNFKYFDPNDIIYDYLKQLIESLPPPPAKNDLIIEKNEFDNSSFYYGLKLLNVLKPLIDKYIDEKLLDPNLKLNFVRINDIDDIKTDKDDSLQVFTKKVDSHRRERLSINTNQFCKDTITKAQDIYKRNYGKDLDFKILEKYNFTLPIFDQSYKTNSLVAKNTGIHRLLSKNKNVVTFGIGYSGIGKSYTFFGDTKRQHNGIVQEIFRLIDNLQNLRIRIYEIHGMASPYSSIWNTDTIKINYSYYDLNDDYKLKPDLNIEDKDAGFYDISIDYILNFSEHIKKIEDIRKQHNFILSNINNPVSSRAVLVIDIKGNNLKGGEFQKTIFDLPGKEDIKYTYNNIKLKQTFNDTLNTSIFKSKIMNDTFISLMLNPLLICMIPTLAKEFNKHCIQSKIFEVIDPNYYIYAIPAEGDIKIKIFNLNILMSDKSIKEKLLIDYNSIDCYKALQFMAYLIYTNNYNMIINFFEKYCEDNNKEQIKMIFQGYFINEILIGIFETLSNSSKDFPQIKFIDIDFINEGYKGKYNLMAIGSDSQILERNIDPFNILIQPHDKLNQFRYLLTFYTQMILNWEDINYDVMKDQLPTVYENYDFMKRYSNKNPLHELFDKVYPKDNYTYTSLVLIQNTIDKDKDEYEYDCNKIIKQMTLLNDAKPFLTI